MGQGYISDYYLKQQKSKRGGGPFESNNIGSGQDERSDNENYIS